MRRTIRLVAATILAAVAFSSFAEAAPPKRIRHRVRHARGATYRTATPRQVVKKKRAPAKRKVAAHHSTATTATHRATPAHTKPSTKPR